jgi:chemotaxis protein methyltransferase CheR
MRKLPPPPWKGSEMAFTFFFRDMHTLDLIVQHVLPNLKGRMRIDIWDAGCAMGPEPYSLAILLKENMGHFEFQNIRLFATDIDESGHFGETVIKGIYPFDQLQRIPTHLMGGYFKPIQDEKDLFQIHDDVRRCIHFQKHDLLSLTPIRSNLGLIMCKNVLLHFQYPERISVIKMFHSALASGGYFVTEQTQKMPEELSHMFKPIVPNAQIYQKVDV